jgi:hypothetical protein
LEYPFQIRQKRGSIFQAVPGCIGYFVHLFEESHQITKDGETNTAIFRTDDPSSQYKGSGPRRSRLTPVVGMPKGEEGRFLLAGERGILGRCLSMPLSDLWIADTLLGPTSKHGL